MSERSESVKAVEIFGRQYGPTMSTNEAAELLNCTPEVLQRDRGKGTLPVEPLQLGRRLRWPSMRIAAALGIESIDGAA
ncbi:MAG: helix-turn-helix domain-containing protein [Acidimicrobiia bacterium]|nr:helix-turn-helix domain-containing protein [Acidimicrobiia bacterium]